MQSTQQQTSSSGELIEATAIVISVDGDTAVLETKRTNACSGCGASAGCGTSALGSVFGQKQNLLHINNDFEAVPGEKVIIGMPEGDLLLASLAVYMVPLVAMILVALLALAAGFGEAVAGIASFLGLAGGFLIAAHLTKNSAVRFTPKYLRRTPFSQASKACGE